MFSTKIRAANTLLVITRTAVEAPDNSAEGDRRAPGAACPPPPAEASPEAIPGTAGDTARTDQTGAARRSTPPWRDRTPAGGV